MDETKRLAMRRAHAGRSHECSLCGKKVYGNGGQSAHGRAHVRRGEAVELVKWYEGASSPSRLFLAPDDPKVAELLGWKEE